MFWFTLSLLLVGLYILKKHASVSKKNKRDDGCEIDISLLDPLHPLLIEHGSNNFLYPQLEEGVIILKQNQLFELHCPGSILKAGGKQFGSSQIVKCLHNENIIINNNNINILHIKCSKKIKSSTRQTNRTCWDKHFEIEIGFLVDKEKFVKLYQSCFDDVKKNVLYTKFCLKKEIGVSNSGTNRPNWIEDVFYRLPEKLDTLFKKNVQQITINTQLGLSPEDTKYISTGNLYIAKGHLVANADYIYRPQKDATFFYINSVPQWQTFNAGNWFQIERSLRNFVIEKKFDVEVYTGTYGISSLPHSVTNQDVLLYLYVNDNGYKAIPIPELLWKVIYNRKTKAAIAVLGVNNPYQTNVTKSIICPDLLNKIGWLKRSVSTSNIQAGYVYACSVDSFRKIVNYLPSFKVNKLLI